MLLGLGGEPGWWGGGGKGVGDRPPLPRYIHFRKQTSVVVLQEMGSVFSFPIYQQNRFVWTLFRLQCVGPGSIQECPGGSQEPLTNYTKYRKCFCCVYMFSYIDFVYFYSVCYGIAYWIAYWIALVIVRASPVPLMS